MPRPPHTESRSTASARAASRTLVPTGNEPRFPEGMNATRTPAGSLMARSWLRRSHERAMSEPAGVRVAFMPSGKRGSFPVGTSVLDAARALAVDLDSVCGGRGICGRCQVEVAEGDHAKLGIGSRAEHLI